MKNTHQKNQNKNKHDPVLLEAVLKYFDFKPVKSYLDVTAGYGGHAKAIMEKLSPDQVTLVDRDISAIAHLKKLFAGDNIQIIHSDYLTASIKLRDDGKKFDIILADLGVSLPHLKEASRGFSLKSDGPLDMRMDQAQLLRASDIVNGSNEAQLIQILRGYGEERRARSIARLIIQNRPIQGTQQLADLIKSISLGYSKVHPATKTFQAIRIVVNDELNQLRQALPIWLDLLNPNGRIGVISFHSLEDRIVKQLFKELSGDRYDAELKLLTKRPVVADRHELVTNPRARSAKLRVAVKINTRKGE